MANKSAAKIEFTGFEELLGAVNVSQESVECERITYIAIQKLETYHNHPYTVENDEEMSSLCDSIADYGILTPLLVRRTKRIDSFEIISGHRRARAAELVKLAEVPAIILALNDDEADIAMVNANLQREHISISEKAKAYRIKYEAMKHQGQSGGRSLKRMEAECRDSQSAIQRLMRIANLSDDLLSMVDGGTIGVVQAADISVLTDTEQDLLHSILLSTKMKITKNQAADLKERSKKGELDEPGILAVLGMGEQKKKKTESKYLIRKEVVRDYFDEEATDTFMVVETDELIRKEKEGNNTLKLVFKNGDPEAFYQVDLDAPAFYQDGKTDKRSSEWVDIEDEDYIPEEKSEGGISSFFSGLLTASPFAITAEAADVTKKWSGKSTIVKSLQTYGADSGYSEVGAKSKAHVYLKDSLITSIKSWIVDTQGLDLEGKIPTMIDVKCCSPGLWGWYSSGALSQCCSGVSLTASIERNSAGEATKVKLYLKCTGASGFQSFSGTVRIPVSEGGGTLTLIKKSTSDNFIKTFTDLKIDTTFMIYDNEACTHEVADIDIDPKSDTGTSVSKVVELDEGTYWIVETHRMVGHIWNTKKYKVVIGNGENTNLTVENQPFYFNGIFLEKKDASSGLPLAGAVFKVTAVRKSETIGTWYFKSDAKGQVAYDAAHYLSSWNGKSSNALIMMNDTVGAALPNSVTLTVQEVEAPAGYLLDSTEHKVGVSTSADGTEYKVAKLTCTPIAKKNQKDEGYLTLIKKDSELGSKVPNKEFYSLAGAVYTVYDSASKAVGTLTTKEDGTTNTIALPTGTYTIKETTAPKGYTLNKNVITVKLTVANTATAPYKAQTTDEAEHGKLKIHKISDENETGAIWKKRDLTGVTFKLTYTKDTSITRTVKTDANGYATVTGLFLGEWKIEEVTPPKYHMAIDPEIITIDDTSIQEAEIENVRYMADLNLVKKEAGTGNVVKRAGAKFQIIDEAGNKVSLKVKGSSSATDTFVTGADGKVTFDEKIPAGKYTLKELAAPAGYKKGSDVAFEVPDNKAVTVEMKDERSVYSGITVTKKDADSGNIAGSGFEFGLYAENDILDGSGTAYAGYEKGKLIEKAVTATDGKASFTKALYPGNYVIKETKAVPGYKLNSADGIIQWSWDRWYGSDGLQRFASSHGRNWQDLALQLAFFKHEAVENNSMAAYFPGGFQKYKTLTSVEGDGGTAHVFFYSFEYGGYVSYATFLSDEFERNFATRTKRLAISRSVYNDRRRYP